MGTRLDKTDMTTRPYFAIFRWTKISPGLEAVMTDSGTLESEQPIQRVYEKD